VKQVKQTGEVLPGAHTKAGMEQKHRRDDLRSALESSKHIFMGEAVKDKPTRHEGPRSSSNVFASWFERGWVERETD